MVQSVMVFGIGFLSAALILLAFIPIVHRRAVRITSARLDEAIPASVQDLRVEKDQMRAQVATSLRRLEVKIEHLKKMNVTHQTEITKKTERLTLLQADLTERIANISALEEQNRGLQEELTAAINQRDNDAATVRAAQRSLAEKEMELDRLADLTSESERKIVEGDLAAAVMRKRLQQSEQLAANLQRDLSQARDRELSVADLHREIDRLEVQIEMMATDAL